MRKYFIFFVVVLVLDGCLPKVGGECKYEKIDGVAFIKSKKDSDCIIDFFPNNNILREWNTKQNLYNTDAKCIGNIKIGKKYPAIYEKSIPPCTPYKMTVYHQSLLKKKDEYKSIRPYLNQGTKDLEKKYPWLYDKMDELLMNEDNIEAYTLDSAYFKILDDLNGDGILEIYLLNYQRCGSGGCSYKIYQVDSKNKKLKEIFDLYDDDKSTVIGKAGVNGWKSISVVHCWGAASCYRYIFKFDTKEKYYLLSEKKAWKAK